MPNRLRRPTGALTRQAVVEAALAVADRDGIDGLTIRGVAELLDAPAMTLYSRFASKSELLDLMYFEVAARLFANVGEGDWEAGLRSVGLAVRDTLTAHPRWSPLLSRPAPPLRSERRERLLHDMHAAGMTPQQAFTALSSVVLASVGLMLVESALRASGESGIAERLAALKKSVDTAESTAELNVTRQALERVTPYELGEIHRQTLDALLIGFRSWLAAPP